MITAAWLVETAFMVVGAGTVGGWLSGSVIGQIVGWLLAAVLIGNGARGLIRR